MPSCNYSFRVSNGATPLRSLGLSVAADEFVWDEFEVADGVTAGDIFPGNLTTVDVLYIESDQAVTYFHNGTATAINLDARKAHMLFGTNITALTLTNGSGSTANIKLGAWGT